MFLCEKMWVIDKQTNLKNFALLMKKSKHIFDFKSNTIIDIIIMVTSI
jgi:hypothetical protein